MTTRSAVRPGWTSSDPVLVQPGPGPGPGPGPSSSAAAGGQQEELENLVPVLVLHWFHWFLWGQQCPLQDVLQLQDLLLDLLLQDLLLDLLLDVMQQQLLQEADVPQGQAEHLLPAELPVGGVSGEEPPQVPEGHLDPSAAAAAAATALTWWSERGRGQLQSPTNHTTLQQRHVQTHEQSLKVSYRR